MAQYFVTNIMHDEILILTFFVQLNKLTLSLKKINLLGVHIYYA
jgi:hypothetical protein